MDRHVTKLSQIESVGSPLAGEAIGFAEPIVVRKLSRTGSMALGPGCGNHCPGLAIISPTEASIVGYQVTPDERAAYEKSFGALPVDFQVVAVPGALLVDLREHICAAVLQSLLPASEDRVLVAGKTLTAERRAFLESTGEIQIYKDEAAIQVQRSEAMARTTLSLQA